MQNETKNKQKDKQWSKKILIVTDRRCIALKK